MSRPELDTRRHKIVCADSPLSALQQRLKYARSLPADAVSYFVENVPVWPAKVFPAPTSPGSDMLQYADCNGSAELIETICQRDNGLYGLSLRAGNVAVTNGGMHALSLAFKHLNPDGKAASAICLAPVFTAVPALMQANGLDVIYYHMCGDQPSADHILSLCREDTKLVYLNFPHNPLGGIYNEAFMQTLVESLSRRNIALVLDMVYDAFIFDDNKIKSPFACNDDWSHIYTVNSVSKNYGAPGLRVGWITSSAKNIEEIAGLLERECVAVCSPAQSKARTLIEYGNQDLRHQIEKSRNVVRQFLQEPPFFFQHTSDSGDTGIHAFAGG